MGSKVLRVLRVGVYRVTPERDGGGRCEHQRHGPVSEFLAG